CKLTGLAEASGQFTKQKEKAWQKPRFPGLFELGPQHLQPTVGVASSGHYQTLETASPNLPQAYRVAFGMVEQHRAVSFGGIEIARPEGDRACPLAQDTAEGQGVPDGLPFLDIVLDNFKGLLGQSL